MPTEPKKTFVLDVKWEFDSEEEREQLRFELSQRDYKLPLRTTKIEYFSHCRLCGRPRKFGTLPYGTYAGMRGDECKPAYARSCLRYQQQGGYDAIVRSESNSD